MLKIMLLGSGTFAFFTSMAAMALGQHFPVCEICACRTIPSGKVVDCSNRNLTSIPGNITNDAVTLDLSNNRITTVPDDSFEDLLLLEKLNLNNNNITSLGRKAFLGLNKLKHLDLSFNRLSVTSDTFCPELFMPLENLRELSLKNNSVNENSTYLAETIGLCSKLEALYIDGLVNSIFGSEYANLTKLTNLTLSSKSCNMTFLPRETFSNTKYLKMLNLANCGLKIVDMCSFCPLSHLEYLDMSYNSPNGLSLIRNVSFGLQFTNITKLKFTNMEYATATGKMITNSDLEFFSNTTIRFLNLSGNMIETLESNATRLFPPNLEEVDLSDNRPVFGPYLLDVAQLKNLRILRANYLNFYHPFGIVGSENNEEIIGNDKTVIDELGGTPLPFILPPKLEEIYCHYSMIPYDIPAIAASTQNSVRRIELNHNAMSRWKGPVSGFDKLEYLDLSVNLCEEISDSFFMNMTSLTSLRVRANFIGYVIEDNLTCPWLKPLKNLATLDLYLNKIRIIPPQCFSTLSNLEFLNLTENSLTDWVLEIEHMPNISVIDLTGNSLDGFPKSTRDHLSEVAKHRNVFINLSGNTLECTCENIEFLEWFDTADITFTNREKYTCRNRQWKELNLTDVKQIISDLKISCADYYFLSTVLSVLIGCFLLVILYGVYHRYKWKLRYIYYTTLGRYQLLHDDDRDNYLYDAYVSYSEEMNFFAAGELAHKLEDLHGLKLFLFERDCLPGRNIRATIANTIEDSRKVILLFTNSYVKNDRCLYELNMACERHMYAKGAVDNICLLKLESVSNKDIPREILTLFKSDSYIEYPNDQQGNNIFWERLKNTLRPRSVV